MPKRGITRAAAEKAVGTLRFAAADKVTAACPIEKGTVCMTAEGVRFETTEDAEHTWESFEKAVPTV